MDSFEFDSSLFDTNKQAKKAKIPKPDFTEVASKIFSTLREHNPTECCKYDLIAKLLMLLQEKVRIPPSDFYLQRTEIGRWLQFIEFLFTNYSAQAQIILKRSLRQVVITSIIAEMNRAEIFFA